MSKALHIKRIEEEIESMFSILYEIRGENKDLEKRIEQKIESLYIILDKLKEE